MRDSNGVVLHVDDRKVVVATGLFRASKNEKTGPMIQIWILPSRENPVAAIKSGGDNVICGDCRHRPVNDGTCYLKVFEAPLQVWKAWKAGTYPTYDRNEHAELFFGRTARFGAYGDPAVIPIGVVRELTEELSSWTGYTHMWRRPSALRYQEFLMASVDTPEEREEALAAGWSVFRARADFEPLLPGEFECPASEAGGKRMNCMECGACRGGVRVGPKGTPSIIVHGSKVKTTIFNRRQREIVGFAV